MTGEFLRTLMVGAGWPLLLAVSVYILIKGLRFYRQADMSPFGKLVLVSAAGWLITIYGFGAVSTFYLFDSASAPRILFPAFIMWFAIITVLFASAAEWNKRAIAHGKIHADLESEVRRRTEDLKRAWRRELENQKQIQRLQDEFLFIAAHELRSPVNATAWGLQTILEDEELSAHLPSEVKEILKTTYERNERLKELTGQLLNTARLEQGILSIKTQSVWPAHIIHEVLKEVQLLASQHAVRLQNEAAHAPPVIADPTLLKEIFTNLITNAIRYNKEHGSVTISETSTAKMVTMRVADTGCGIPSNQLEHLFEKFHRIKQNTPLGGEKSVGLGLYITKELVTRMGGTIRAESVLNKGSVFIFTLPRDVS